SLPGEGYISAADGRHGARGLEEVRVVDAVSRQLAAHRGDHEGGELLVGGARPQRGAQVGLRPGEQAVADLPISRQPDPVARGAEGAGDRADDADRRRVEDPARATGAV